jgi:hypothetical protein
MPSRDVAKPAEDRSQGATRIDADLVEDVAHVRLDGVR